MLLVVRVQQWKIFDNTSEQVLALYIWYVRDCSFGNRRLWAFKWYQDRVGSSRDIRVPVTLNQRGSSRLSGGRSRFTTQNDGVSVQVNY